MNLLDKIYDAGVVGAGGAGFPTHIKLNCRVEYLVLNGVECEPLIKTDQYIMREKSHEIIKAAEAIGNAVGADKIIIGLKAKYKQEIEAIKRAVSSLNSRIKLHFLDAYYPAGDEQMLVYEVTGKSIPPGGIPLNVGAVVTNVGTAFNIYEAMEGRPVTHKYLTVTGEVKAPTLLKVPIGTKVSRCIEEAGGVAIDDYSIIMGGPMMGKILEGDEINSRVITKTDGAIIVIPQDHYIKNRSRISIQHITNQARSACIQCTYCTELCPRYLIGHKLRPHKIMRALSLGDEKNEIFKEALICCECGICELYACPMGLSPRMVNIYYKNKLRKENIKYEFDGREITPSGMREYRRVPQKRLISRIMMDKYEHQPIGELKEILVNEVKIPLRQHIGAPAVPVVKAGDHVHKGQLIGKVERGSVGANVHASMEGIVASISDRIVVKEAGCEVIT